VVLERVGRCRRRVAAPERVGEAVDRYRAVRGEEQQGKQGALLVSAQRDSAAVFLDLEWT
jgi:hypothetical protein